MCALAKSAGAERLSLETGGVAFHLRLSRIIAAARGAPRLLGAASTRRLFRISISSRSMVGIGGGPSASVPRCLRIIRTIARRVRRAFHAQRFVFVVGGGRHGDGKRGMAYGGQAREAYSRQWLVPLRDRILPATACTRVFAYHRWRNAVDA